MLLNPTTARLFEVRDYRDNRLNAMIAATVRTTGAIDEVDLRTFFASLHTVHAGLVSDPGPGADLVSVEPGATSFRLKSWKITPEGLVPATAGGATVSVLAIGTARAVR